MIAEIESSITKLPDVIHEELLKLVILYCHLGGMPEVIADYLKQQNFQNTARIQNSLLNSFRQDFLKYSTKYQIDAVSEVFDAIPRQLTKKFVYNAVNQNIKSTKLSAALELLNKAGVCKKIFHTQANGIPLGSEIKPNLFKVTFLDIGLALRLLGINLYAHSLESQQQNFAPEEISLNYVNKGAIAEQFVAQELCSYQDCFSPANLYYWVREQPSSMAELDYLIAKNDQILPIEVKSGTAGNLKSMHLFLKEKPQIKAGYRISSRRYEVFRTITSIPLYGIWTLIQA